MPSDLDELNGIKSVETILKYWYYFGLYSKDHVSTTKYWLYSMMVHLPFTYVLALSLVLSAFDMSDLGMLTNLLHTNINILIYTVKVSVFIVNFRKVRSLINDLKTLAGQYDLEDLTEMLIIAKKIKLSKRIFRYFFTVYLVTAFFYGAKTLIKSNELIFKAMLPYDWNGSHIAYWFTYCYQFLGMLLMVILNSAMDSFLPSILCMLGGYCDVLGYSFTKIDRFIVSNTEEEFLKRMATRYTHICRLAKSVEQIYSLIILGQFSMSLGIVCTTLFQISLAPPENIVNYLALCLYMLAVFIEIAVPCYFGDDIYTKSGDLLFSLYSCNWMGLNPQMKSNIIILMQFSNRPIQISAYSLVILKIDTVNKILHTAYSFYTVLRSMTGKAN